MNSTEWVYVVIGAFPVVLYTVYLRVVSKRAIRSGAKNPYRFLEHPFVIGGVGGWVVGSGFLASQRDAWGTTVGLIPVYLVFLGVMSQVMRESRRYQEMMSVVRQGIKDANEGRVHDLGSFAQYLEDDEDGKGTDA